MTPQQHRKFACDSHTIYDKTDKAVIIGEWTGAMTDCTPYLNGYNNGSRYEGKMTKSTFHGKYPPNHDIKTWSQQMNTFEQNSKGWVW